MPPGDHKHSPGYCDSLTHRILAAVFEVSNTLAAGFLELTLRNIRAAPSAAHSPPCIRWSYTEFVAAADPLENCTGFDWPAAGTHQNRLRLRVTPQEAEDAFFHEPLVVRSDLRHSKRKGEKRYYALGQTASGRRLFVVFTLRGTLIRVISARDMNRNETETYERHEEETS